LACFCHTSAPTSLASTSASTAQPKTPSQSARALYLSPTTTSLHPNITQHHHRRNRACVRSDYLTGRFDFNKPAAKYRSITSSMATVRDARGVSS
jgi:hypothetical protein